MNEHEKIKHIKIKIEQEVGPTFCLAKWHHTTLYLQTGETHSCYHPPPHKMSLPAVLENPSAMHNTAHKKEERRLMLEGKKPDGCAYCWNIESLGSDYVSDRHIRNASIFTEQRYKETAQGLWNQDINPEYIEVNFGNECNFKCGYCHPKFSTRFYNEIKQHGPVTTVKNHRCDIDWLNLYSREDENPYVDAFWRWWPELKKTLNIMRITGGEPLMHASTWRLFDLINNDPLPHLELNINSNLGVKNSLVTRLANNAEQLKQENKIKNFKLFTSIDTWGTRAEYIRTGLDLQLWEENFHTYLTKTTSPITFMITFNILSVTTFRSLLEKILEWRRQYGWYDSLQQHRIRFDTPYLREPLQYDMNLLPKEEFIMYMQDHLNFMQQNIDDSASGKFTTVEYEKFKRVVDYMAVTTYDSEKLKQGRSDFYNWFTALDLRRNTNFLLTFPEMESFFRLCQTANTGN